MDIPRIRLPHTGMQVPRRFLILATSLDQVDVGTGIAWSAALSVWSEDGRFQGMRLGTAVNNGRGADTLFNPDSPKAAKALKIYAAMCVDTDGTAPSVDQVCDHLADEFEIAREVERARRYRYYLLRAFNEWDIPVLMQLKAESGLYPDFEAAHKAAEQLGLPEGGVRTELWMGPAREWAQVLPRPNVTDS
ncbi:hypothetical protein [Nocardiopsis sp. NRRL B-16309]|uniref:hypothetical protein n=1 Tax=Nocardiopsis sp. NRRL B-16309 TaxID=1519494 RepID=UPI0006B03D13|nr:hypothetical protein [Nocardiopsis sp. NRRL B-16309]KOX23831.1 hypothetical protein ADL05_01890 [Nocardiopsis sp. NRRL B-16309]